MFNPTKDWMDCRQDEAAKQFRVPWLVSTQSISSPPLDENPCFWGNDMKIYDL